MDSWNDPYFFFFDKKLEKTVNFQENSTKIYEKVTNIHEKLTNIHEKLTKIHFSCFFSHNFNQNSTKKTKYGSFLECHFGALLCMLLAARLWYKKCTKCTKLRRSGKKFSIFMHWVQRHGSTKSPSCYLKTTL